MRRARLRAIDYHLPQRILDNAQLAAQFAGWTADRIEEKTGISERHIVGDGECASDLGVIASESLFSNGKYGPSDIDFLLFCTQSPDYFLPTTACTIQRRLGLSNCVGALDFNLGCSGFIYGLGLAKGLVETEQASRVLLITAETYSKFIHPDDKSVRTIFGDGASASIIDAVQSDRDLIGPFVYGTDGRGAENLIVRTGCMRHREISTREAEIDESGNLRTPNNIYMNGPEIFTFTLRTIPSAVRQLLDKAQHELDDIDLFIFHQANQFMLDRLRGKCGIPEERFYVALRHFGNTVSSTIPIALTEAAREGRLHDGMRLLLVGFGVGYSWGAVEVEWASKI